MSRAIRLLTAGTLAGMFATAAALHWWENRAPSLTSEGEVIRDGLLERFGKYNDDKATKCAADYLALHQAESLSKRAAFQRSSEESHHSQEEIDSVLKIEEDKEFNYTLYVFMACHNGEKPEPLYPR